MIEHMFDTLENAELRQATAALETMGAASRQENVAGAARLAAIADLYEVRAPDDDVDKINWVIDGYCGLVAEVAVAQGVSQRRAKAQVELAIALRERLPAVAAVYAVGAIDRRLIGMVVSRTDLVEDPERLAMIDAKLAAKITRWTRLSGPQQQKRIDDVIARSDPAGVRAPRPAVDRRRVDIEPNLAGTADVWANVRAEVGAALNAALDVLADGVCRRDPRTKIQRRADALGALALGRTLACECAEDTCPAVNAPQGQVAGKFVIHVIAGQATLTGDPHSPGLLPGHGLIPAEQVTQLIAHGATIREVAIPAAAAEPGYRPSTALAEFIRCRDLTCRFPGCDVPAARCDIDHTVPWPAGPTHPSNLKLLCRFHHLIKTFHPGWNDTQAPDGAVEWTTPTGHRHTTTPHGAYWFPVLGTPTGTTTLAPTRSIPGRELKMPTRTRPRTQERTQRIQAERAHNQTRLDQRKKHSPLGSEASTHPENQEPPPF